MADRFVRGLGDRQARVLRALREHGGWARQCGWVWTTPKETETILDSLVKRGLAFVDAEGWYRPKPETFL